MLEVVGTLNLAITSLGTDAKHTRRLAEWVDRQCPADAAIGFLVRFAQAAAALFAGDIAVARISLPRVHPGETMIVALLALATGERAPLRDALEMLDHYGELGIFAGARELILGVTAVLDGDLGAARERLRCVRRPSSLSVVARHQLEQIALALGDEITSQEIIAELEREDGGNGANLNLAYIDLVRGYWARTRSPSEAEAAAHRGVARLVEFGFVFFLPRALELLAVIMGESGRLAEAGRVLGAVEAYRARSGHGDSYPLPPLDELRARLDPATVEEGARMSLEEAAEYAHRGRGERGRPDHGWESLTPTEARVVELVASGLPNKEIAQKLFVSVATVKTHLVHVYTKLDVRTRAELAAEATRRARQS